ncbi:MAG TPA: SDR family oxidoreductase [Solirubrobacteraceae bacterium]|jgi:NAD(P)-dependent dehydrogenase (short-subunit alcohol dehydrogenase family)|nr:SDR family oxidoreductase [Solirubrobacteraceae bacterium]
MARTPRSLAGSVVAITGGGRGIGRATAVALIAQGARVALGDIDAGLAERTAEELGSGTLGLPLDVTDRDSFARFLDQVEERFGRLDILINNAGIMPIGPFVEESDTMAARVVDINLTGVIIGSKLALQRFTQRGTGHLVNIASTAGKAGVSGGATYCATKHAVVGLSEAIRQEVRGTGVDVTVIMPHVVNTELGSGLSNTRLVKLVEPEDVAEAIVGALQTGRYQVVIPRIMGLLLWSKALVPTPVAELVARLLKGDAVLVNPDHVARAAYEARMAQPVTGAETRPQAAAPETPTPEREAQVA